MARKKKDDAQGTLQVQDIPHEVVKANTAPPAEKLQLLSVEETIQLSVEKFDLSMATIADWKKEYASLATIPDDNKEDYKKLEEALRKVKKTRTSGDKLREELVADSLAIQRGINGRWKELEEALREVETPLQKRKTEIDKAKEIAAAKLEEERQQKLQGRVADLLGNGMSFNGSYYAIGDTISMDVVTLKAMDDEAFGAFKTRVEAQQKIILDAAVKAEQERKDREVAAEALRLEQEAEAKRLQAEKDELARQRQELEDQKKAMQKQIEQGRRTLLINAGFSLLPNGNMRINLKTGENSTSGAQVSTEIIESADAKYWQQVYDEAIAAADQSKAENKKYLSDKAEAEAAEAKRKEAEAKEQEEARLAKVALATRTLLRQQTLVDRYKMHQQKAGTPFCQFIRESDLPNSDVRVLQNTIETLSDEEWEAGLSVIQKRVDEILEAERAQLEIKVLEQQAQERREAEELEAARQLQLGDAEKVKEYAAAVRAIKVPLLKDESVSQQLTYFMGSLESLEELAAELLAEAAAAN